MLRSQDRFKRAGEGCLRFIVQQVPGEIKHEFISESLAKSGVLGLYQRWKKARARKPDDYPECKAVLIDNQGMSVLVYSFQEESLGCGPAQSFIMEPVQIDYPGGHFVLRPAGLARRKF